MEIRRNAYLYIDKVIKHGGEPMDIKWVIIIAFAIGLISGIVVYALSAFIARIFVEVTLPAAEVKTNDLKIDVAPYQSFEYTGALIASINQRSDLVQYTLKIKAENLQLYSACITVMSWGVEYYKGCGLEHTFKMKSIPGGFSVYLTVKGRSTNTTGLITAEITYEPLP